MTHSRFAALLAACIGSLTLADAAAAQSPLEGRPGQAESKRFRDWSVVCDNLRTCTAFAYVTGDIVLGVGPFLWLRREAGPGAEVEVGVNVGYAEMEESPAAGAPVRLRIEGGGAPTDFDGVVREDEETGLRMVWIEGARGRAFVEALVRGDRLAVSAAGRELGAVSLSGSSATLRFIDDRQGRADSVTALVAKGVKPAASVPAAPAPPVIRRGAPVSQDGLPERPPLPPALASRPEVVQCIDDHADPEGDFGGVNVSRLSQTDYLWAVPCGRGAYNFSSRYFIAGRDGSNPRSAGLDGYDDTLVNSGYDAESRTLSAFSKGRGIGDCGDEAEWVWDGRRFQLLRRAFMEDCLGVPSSMWPSFWQARVEE